MEMIVGTAKLDLKEPTSWSIAVVEGGCTAWVDIGIERVS